MKRTLIRRKKREHEKNKVVVNEPEVLEFWDWFSRNEKILAENFENNDLLDELDQKITRLGAFAWELGPGILKDNLFAFSPGGDVDMLPLTKFIIARAPTLNDWEFYFAKPPKTWDLRFDFFSSSNAMISVNGNTWEYVLLKYGPTDFEILLQVNDLNEISYDDQLKVAEILLDGILGEEVRISYFSLIEILLDFKEYESSRSSLSSLRQHFAGYVGYLP